MHEFVRGDAARLPFADDSFGLVIGSPPYGPQRLYLEDGKDLGVALNCVRWVEWMLGVTMEAARVSRGLVVWVVSGWQEDGSYQPGPEGLLWEWYKRGLCSWAPCAWWKVDESERGTGVPGSGGKQGLRKDWEYCLIFKPEGELLWADNLAMGHAPAVKQAGGSMSNRGKDGSRAGTVGAKGINGKQGREGRQYKVPEKSNPGNFIVCARVGGGHIGDWFAHKSEAPFPERIPEFFIRSFCKTGDFVLDPFSGSGTTVKVAEKFERVGIGLELRPSQIAIAQDRLAAANNGLFGNV